MAQRGFVDTFAGSSEAAARAAKLRLEGSADVTKELEEIGLSGKTGWYASVLLYGVGGIATVLVGLLRVDQVGFSVPILGGCALVLAVLGMFGARYFTNSNWATHARLVCGMAIFAAGAVAAGPLSQAFVMLPLFVLITPTFIYGARFAVPYLAVVPTFIFIVLLLISGPARVAHAIVSVGAILMIVISFMIAEQRTRKLARVNRKLAYTDPLTGIANMRRLRERLTEALGKPFGAGQPFALFAIDLDNFKLVNDNFDHSTGDSVLVAVAAGLEAEVDPSDLVARRGGDEFSVLISDPADRDLDELSARLAQAIATARRATCPQITPSGSIAYVRSTVEDTIASVLQRADDELHAEKSAFHAEHGSRESVDVGVTLREANADLQSPLQSRASYRSMSAAVSRAYQPRSTSFEVSWKRFVDRIRSELAGLDPIWSFVTMMVAPITIVFIALVVLGLLEPLTLSAGLSIAAGYLALTALSVYGARKKLSKRLTHVVFAGTVLLITLVLVLAGESGAAVLDAYTIVVLYTFYFMNTRVAAIYLAICSALYIGFAIGAHYPDGGTRAGITVSVLIVAAALVSKVRSLTLRFLRTNRELSEIDALTGVANLRALKARVEDSIDGARHDDRRPVIVTVDLDKFKQVNDSYNHTVGDQVLEAVARAVSEVVREDELVARRGGDEFFILFRDASDEHIDVVMPRLREAVRHARLRICPDLTPSASVGRVTWRRGQDAETFMRNADLAMHDEKIDSREHGYTEQRESA